MNGAPADGLNNKEGSGRTAMQRTAAWLPAGLYAALIFYLSSRPQPLPRDLFQYPHPDKLLHFIEYAVLGALIFKALSPETLPARGVAAAFLIATLFGLSDEIHQHFVPSREADPADLAADALGAFAGGLLACRCMGRRPLE